MTKKQIQAKAQLERAFAACSKAGLMQHTFDGHVLIDGQFKKISV